LLQHAQRSLGLGLEIQAMLHASCSAASWMSCTCGQDQMVDGRNSEKEAELMRSHSRCIRPECHPPPMQKARFCDLASIALSRHRNAKFADCSGACMKKGP
jgi:hypothetical protein